MAKIFAVLFLSFSVISYAYSQIKEPHKVLATRVHDSPKIDGHLDEHFWETLPPAFNGKFTQFLPVNGKASAFETQLKIGYSDYAIYVSARLFDPSPDSILTELGLRDDMGRNADMFGVSFDTYNNGQNAFYFIVSAAGVQTDMLVTPRNWDRDWDAVWNSAVSINENGWVAEIEIPYSALRMPKQEVQLWGINFMRDIKRKREETYWNPVDNSVNGFVNQFGLLKGIENIKPPPRLSFLPYITAVSNHDGLNNRKTTNLTGGMDLKLGLNESYTLDVSLIPDFSQVLSDNVVLNLSPFEVRFNENRPFFIEGTELFERGGIFYSRRIGHSFGRVAEELNDNEKVVERPATANMLNAAKISGRNSKGLGIGIFNAVTDKTYVIVENEETGERRRVDGDPLTNFNVLVVDKNFKNNSHFSVINTNVTRADGGDNANVTATDFRVVNKTNTYALSGFAALSQLMEKEEDGINITPGYRYNFNVAKISGKYRFNAGRNVMSDTYDINDMGYLARANEINHFANVSYHIFKPFSIFNRMNYGVGFSQGMLYEPNVFTHYNLYSNASTQFKNFWNLNLNLRVTPAESFDYFEPREAGRVFVRPASFSTGFWINTDSRKRLSLNARANVYARPEWDQINNNIGIHPQIRINNKLSFDYNFDLGNSVNSVGYVTKLYNETYTDQLENIMFGLRDIQTVTNTVGGRLIFNKRMGLNLRMRHYWSKVQYNDYYVLNEKGYLENSNYTGRDADGMLKHDKNFNALNVDLVYSWQIAPGSFMNIVWKDAIFTDTNDVSPGFIENLGNTINAPQINSFSVRLLYYLDYFSIKKKLKPFKPGKTNDSNIIAFESFLNRAL